MAKFADLFEGRTYSQVLEDVKKKPKYTVDSRGNMVPMGNTPTKPVRSGQSTVSAQARATRDARGLTGARSQPVGGDGIVPRVTRTPEMDRRSFESAAGGMERRGEDVGSRLGESTGVLTSAMSLLYGAGRERAGGTPEVIAPEEENPRGRMVPHNRDVPFRLIERDAEGNRVERPYEGRGSISSGFQDSYGGEDVSQLSPREYLDRKIEKSLRASEIMRGTRERFGGNRMAPFGADSVMRHQALKDYKKELDQILQDSASRRLTARQTSNAIGGLKDYYGELLGLDKTRLEEAGATTRQKMSGDTSRDVAAIGAQARTPQSDEPQFVFEQDRDGNLVLANKFTGESRYNMSPEITQTFYDYQKAVAAGESEEAERLKFILRGFGIDVENPNG